MLTLRPFSAIIVKDQSKALKCAKNYLIQEFCKLISSFSFNFSTPLTIFVICTRSLSNVFLISNIRTCFLTRLDPEQRRAIIRTLDTKKELRLLDDDVIITCRNVHRVLTDDEENDDDMNDRLDQTKQHQQRIKGIGYDCIFIH